MPKLDLEVDLSWLPFIAIHIFVQSRSWLKTWYIAIWCLTKSCRIWTLLLCKHYAPLNSHTHWPCACTALYSGHDKKQTADHAHCNSCFLFLHCNLHIQVYTPFSYSFGYVGTVSNFGHHMRKFYEVFSNSHYLAKQYRMPKFLEHMEIGPMQRDVLQI